MSGIDDLSWCEPGKEVSKDLLQRQFTSPQYRVTTKIYRACESRPPGAARAGILFVLRGKCKCSFGKDEGLSIFLEAGQYVHFLEGSYRIDPLNQQDAEIAFVWNLVNLLRESFLSHPDAIIWVFMWLRLSNMIDQAVRRS